MSWKNNLQDASFRGVPFKVAVAETSVGRRTEMHVYPNTKGKYRNFVWAEDLGPQPDTFTIEGYVIQNLDNNFDYFDERDALIAALKTQGNALNLKDGSGILVHPYFDEPMRVSLAEPAKIVESFSEGGIAKFTMTFVQYNEPIFTEQDKDFLNAVDTSALATINRALDSFTDLMDTAGSFLNNLTAPITKIMAKMNNVINSTKGAVASTISTALGTISSALALTANLLDSPCALANQLLNAVDSVKNLYGAAGEVVQGGIIGSCSGVTRYSGGSSTGFGEATKIDEQIIIMDGTSVPESLGTSLTENLANESNYTDASLGTITDSEADNLTLINNTMQAFMLANATRVGIRVEYQSQEQMISTMETVAEAFDDLLDRLGDQIDTIDNPLLFQSVQDLRAVFVSSMLEKNADLTKEIQYTVPSGVQSALELAYNKYDDIERSSEIYSRNRIAIKHPGFLPSGSEINILDE